MREGMYAGNLGNPHGLTVNPLILAVRYIIAVANVFYWVRRDRGR